MKTIFSLIALFALLTVSAPAVSLEAPYPIPITRQGTTHKMLAYNWWSGEYPRPVISAQSVNSGRPVISAYQSLRTLDRQVPCTIKPGIYHPWSKDDISLINYYSITELIEYQALRRTRLAEHTILDIKDRILAEAYLAENHCAYVVKTPKGRRVVTDVCDSVGDETKFRRIEHPAHDPEQWLYLSCDEGYKAFVKDTDMLAQEGISEGQMRGYGKVGP